MKPENAIWSFILGVSLLKCSVVLIIAVAGARGSDVVVHKSIWGK